MKFKLFLLSLFVASSAWAAHTNDRAIYQTDVKNKTNASVFRFPTTLPTASKVCVFNADSEPVSSSVSSSDLDTILGGGWALSGNALSGGEFLGSTNDTDVVFKVNGEEMGRLQSASSHSIAFGYLSLNSGIASTVGGGQGCNITGDYSTISGGDYNSISTSSESFIGGGDFNTIGADTSGTDFNVLVGGSGNTVAGTVDFLGGGNGNNLSGQNSTLVGGQGNNSNNGTDYSFLGGGTQNTVYNSGSSGGYSTLVGGYGNSVAGTAGFVGGGLSCQSYGNYAVTVGGNGNLSSGDNSFVGGGNNNNASARATTIGGGAGSTAEGDFATIPGGFGLHTNNFAQTAIGRYNVLASGSDAVNLSQTSIAFIIGNGTTGGALGTAEQWSFDGAEELNTVATTANGSTSGTITCTMPSRGTGEKKVLCYCSALLGTATYTYPKAFAHAPDKQGGSSSIVTSATTTALSVTGSTTTGWIFLQGF